MKPRFLILSAVVITLGLVLTSCSNKPKNSRNIIGEINKLSPEITNNYSEFSGTQSYKFTISDETVFECSLKIRTGKTSLTLVDEKGKEYLSLNSSSQDKVTLNPSEETTYYIDLKYDNGVGTYSLKLY